MFGVLALMGMLKNRLGKTIEALKASCKEYGQELERAHSSSEAAPLGTSPEARRHEYAGSTTTPTTPTPPTNNNALDSIPHIDNTLDVFDIPIPDVLILRHPHLSRRSHEHDHDHDHIEIGTIVPAITDPLLAPRVCNLGVRPLKLSVNY